MKVAGTDLDGTEIPMFPADLAGEPLLLAHAGMLLQTQQKRPDGWAFGVVIYDPGRRNKETQNDTKPKPRASTSSWGGWRALDAAVRPGVRKALDVAPGKQARTNDATEDDFDNEIDG